MKNRRQVTRIALLVALVLTLALIPVASKAGYWMGEWVETPRAQIRTAAGDCAHLVDRVCKERCDEFGPTGDFACMPPG